MKGKRKQKRKAFTLVELLAVIVILAVILIIAVPQIMNTIRTSRLKSMEDSIKLIATTAEKDFLSQQTLKSNYNVTKIPCSDVAKLSDDYSYCTIIYNDGEATVKLRGKNNGKYSNIKCRGTKDTVDCKEIVPLDGYTDAVELLTSKIGTGGLEKDNHDELRYVGETVDNYVTFNNEEAGWRIIGLFNLDGEQRIKLVRKDSIGGYSWDSSESTINSGNGVNEWTQSNLKNILNNYYYNGVADGTCYNAKENGYTTCSFNGLTNEAKNLIGDATWYLGGSQSSRSLSTQYALERFKYTCKSRNMCPNDDVSRSIKWVGKIGLIYPSDYGYASGDSRCTTNIGYINSGSYCGNNWMTLYGWTISPGYTDGEGAFIATDNKVFGYTTYYAYNVHPSIYLISDVQMKGSGTASDPYIFAE